MRLLGTVEGKDLYAEWNSSYNQVRFSLDGEEIGVFDANVMNIMETPIIYRSNTIANELSSSAKDQIQTLTRETDIEQLKEDELEYSEQTRSRIAEALQIEDEEVVSLTEINLDEKVETKDEKPREVQEKKDEPATTKDITIKQELQMDTMATSMKTIGQILQRAGKIPQVDGKSFTRIGIVESDDIKNIDKDAKTNTTRFSFVAIASDGTVVPIDLEQDHQEGNNPREIGYRVNADGRVEQDDVDSRYKIGNSGETISIKHSNGPGNLEVGFSSHKTLGGNNIEGNKSIDHQLQTDSVYWKPRADSREKEYGEGIYGTQDRAEEANIEAIHNEDWKEGKKGNPNDKSDEHKDIDGDQNTKDSSHEYDIIERARALMREDEDVSNIFTEEEVVEMLENAHDNGKSLDEAEESIKEDASRMPGRNK